MNSVRATTRLALTIGFIVGTVIWIGVGMKFMPNPTESLTKKRVQLCEQMAIFTSMFVRESQLGGIETTFLEILSRHSDLCSITLRRCDGELISQVGEPKLARASSDEVDLNYLAVDIYNFGKPWGVLELEFKQMNEVSSPAFTLFPIPFILFCSSASIFVIRIYLAKTLKQLNPSKVVPGRVRSAFDSLAEGLILVDKHFQIMLANEAFGKIVGRDPETLIGAQPEDFPWQLPSELDEEDIISTEEQSKSLPWRTCLKTLTACNGQMLLLKTESGTRKFLVNTNPITSDKNQCRGILVSFDDITALDEKQQQLKEMLGILESSRDEIQRQNKELQVLASVDPLSTCFNRRHFFSEVETIWKEKDNLATIMVDIDHFKSINDNYGHATGDVVINNTGQLLRRVVGDHGLVCRYGGEEFCVLLIDTETDFAEEIGWNINREMASVALETDKGTLSYTCSVGVSHKKDGAKNIEDLIDESDQCLYIAKRTGRNQVVRWDTADRSILDDVEESEKDIVLKASVEALISSLAFRDLSTAEHCRRVANMSREVGKVFFSEKVDLDELETAALLHDIGKIGVPDHVLLKPGPLTNDEWTVMRKHDQMSYEVARTAKLSDRICNAILQHHGRFSDGQVYEVCEGSTLLGKIISTCDAYDAMISDRVYRDGMPHELAMKEIYRNTPDQFDAEIVQALANVLEEDRGIIESKSLEHFTEEAKEILEDQVSRLQIALNEGKVSQVEELLKQLKLNSGVEKQTSAIHDTASKLHDLLEQSDSELRDLQKLAEQIMDLSTEICAPRSFSTVTDFVRDMHDMPEE